MTLSRTILLLALTTILILAAVQPQLSCRSTPADPRANAGLPTLPMTIAGRNFTVEVASTERERQTGLMYRDGMADDHGMIFVFADEAPLEFWMGNCLFPMDAVFINAKQQVVSYKTMKVYPKGIDDGTR